MDSQILEYSLQHQGYWIKTLQIVYPFGLNQQTKFTSTNLISSLPKYGEIRVAARKRFVQNENNLHLTLILLSV